MVMPSGLTTRYKCDETSGTTLNDSIGTNHATLSGSGIQFAYDNQLGRFVVDKSIESPDTKIVTPLLINSTSFSFCFWKKQQTQEYDYGMVFHLKSTSSGVAYTFYTHSNDMGMQKNSPPYPNYRVEYGYLSEERWTHFTFTMLNNGDNTGTLKLYKNGVLLSTQTIPSGVFITSGFTACDIFSQKGANGSSSLYYASRGSLRDFCVFDNKVLTDSEVLDVFNETYVQPRNMNTIFNNCVAYYDCSKNSLNVVGDNQPVPANLTATTNHLNQTNSAYVFNNSNSQLRVPYVSTIDVKGSEYTFSCWALQTSTVSGEHYFFHQQTSSQGHNSRLFLANGTNRVNFVCYTNPIVLLPLDTGFDITNNVWFNITVTFKHNDYVRIYVNGNEICNSAVGAFAYGGVVGNYDNGFGYAESTFGDSGSWNGSMCNFMWFNKQLTADQVKQLYDLTKSKVVHPIVKGGRD